jgi:hypothetical protein
MAEKHDAPAEAQDSTLPASGIARLATPDDLPLPPGMPGMHPPMRTPAFTADNTPCLRGPCRYYWEVWTHFEHGNALDTPGLGEPRERAASCMRHPGVEMPITADAPVLACNQWSPIDPKENP